MTTQLDRIQVLDAPMAAPGHCAICGSTSGRMVDFGMNVEFYGVIYFCVDNCLVELANSFEYHSPRQWKMLMNQIEDQRDEINGLRDQNEQLRADMGALARISGLSDIDRTPELDVAAIAQEPDSEPKQLSFDFTGGEESDTRQDDEPRSANILDNDDDLEKFFGSI